MAKGGRPSKYKPEYCEMLIAHMSDGYSFESFAATIGVNRDTLYEWTTRHVEFSDAKKTGRDASLYYWEKVGKDGLYNEVIKDGDGMTVTRSINATVWIFNMKNKHGWRDKQEVVTTDESTDNLAAEVKTLSDELKRLDSIK